MIAHGPIEEVLTSAAVSACFDLPVSIGHDDGRWWCRASS
jgi:iron complex transport system ATP-binding protein